MKNAMFVQEVASVERATTLLEEITTKEAIEQLIGGPVEACSRYLATVVGKPLQTAQPTNLQRVRGTRQGLMHPFVGTIHQAYEDHRPLVLSPDMFWLLITQGLALHINSNADQFRDRFQSGPTKRELIVERDDFYRGSLENPWEEVFASFAQQIESHIGTQEYSQIVVDFSTTGLVERTANAIVLMDCMQSFFNYTLSTRCGIPEVVLEGVSADWEKLRDSTRTLGESYDLTWWTDRMEPVLDQIVENVAGKDSPELWQTIYKQINASGGPHITGWIADFFPYLTINQQITPNPGFNQQPPPEDDDIDFEPFHLKANMLPSPLSKAPLRWEYEDKVFNMELLAGFIGFTQEAETLRLRPSIGWAVREA